MSNPESIPVHRRRGFLLRFLAILAASIVVAVLLTGSSLSMPGLARSFGISFVYSVCVGVPGSLLLTRVGPGCGRLRAPWNWTLFLATCAAVAVAGCLLAVAVLVGVGAFPAAQYWQIFAGDVRLCIVITMAFGTGSFLYEMMRGKLERAMLEEERARFSSLESRIHPHFLFNTLNSISALIREDPRKAERTVEQLSALLRYSLDMNTGRLAPLRQEMRIVTDYLEIEKTRFGDRLRYSIDVPGSLEDWQVPPMSVQTLVENSIKHAISQSRAGGEVRIAARMDEDRFLIEVSDDGPGFSAADMKEGHGLHSLRERLAGVFAEDAALRIVSGQGRTTVSVSIPQKRVLV